MVEMARSLLDYAAPPVARANAPVNRAQPKSLLDYISEIDLLRMLEGTGIPERAAAANDLLNPLAAIPRAQDASQELFAPNRTGMERLSSTGNMLTELAGIAAPIAAAARAGVPAATALMEGLLGGSPTTQAVGDTARGFLADESGALPLGKPTLDVSRRDASDIFGVGSERVRYTDPNSGGTIEVVVRPDGSASVLELEVPEAFRGRGIGQTLQARALQDFPKMGGQVSSKAAATTAYRLGRRPQGNPDATLDEVFAAIDDMSSVNMVSPAMQTAPAQARGFLADDFGTSNPPSFGEYLKRVNPSNVRVAAEDRPNLMMGDMYGMLPRGARRVQRQGDVTFYKGPENNYFATAFNPDVGEQDVVGYIMPRGDMTELAVVDEMQGRGIGSNLQYLFRKENPDAPTGGLTEAGERALRRTYERLVNEGILPR
jgi:ribosomal protein S18 acetylase RimI-like enzyme